MTFDDLYSRGVMPVQHTVCGLMLRDMTVGHARVLTALELWNPRSSRELLLAAFICAHEVRTFSRWWSSYWFMFALRFWRWRLGPKWDFNKSREAWAEYVEYHTDEPAATFEKSNRTSRTPWLDTLKAGLCKHMNYDPMRFDSVKLHEATRDYASIAEMDGVASILNMSVSQSRQVVMAFQGGQ